jgi:hypothetical protein
MDFLVKSGNDKNNAVSTVMAVERRRLCADGWAGVCAAMVASRVLLGRLDLRFVLFLGLRVDGGAAGDAYGRSAKGILRHENSLAQKDFRGGIRSGNTPVSLLAGFFMLYLYCWIFSFYGLFLSVFAEMKPLNLFGRNGFINSDFFTPVAYLTDNFWPMILATLAANWRDFLRHQALERMVFPFKNHDILHIHVMILVMPFLAMITWALFRDAYQQWTVVLLVGLFYLLPKKRKKEDHVVGQSFGGQ